MGRDRAYEGTQCLDKVWLERDMKVGGHGFRITGRWQNVPLGLLGGCVYTIASRNGGICLYMAAPNPHSQLLQVFSSLNSDIYASSPALRAVLDDLSQELASNKALR